MVSASQPPQLIHNARMIIAGFEADWTSLEEVPPTGLSPHAHNTIQVNMYEIEADQSSDSGGFSLTYLTVEIDGHDSLAGDGTVAIPGRFFAYYWNSSPRGIAYARERAGNPPCLVCAPGRWTTAC
jgi:hypothetical protein